MRVIDAALTTLQQQRAYRRAAPAVTIGGVDRSGDLVRYTYRERALRAVHSTVWLDNSDGALTAYAPLGLAVDLARGGATDSGAVYRAALPRLWVDSATLTPRTLALDCVGLWGKLSRWVADTTYSWSSTGINTVLDAILGYAGGITRDGAPASVTLDYAFDAGVTGDVAFKGALAKSGDVAYAGLAGTVKFKNLEADTTPVYDYGWNANHPLIDVAVTQGLTRYNKVVVYGSGAYTAYAEDAAQMALAGTRTLTITDTTLTSDFMCLVRAKGELQYQLALAAQMQATSLPAHGLEVFDLCTLAAPPWGGSARDARCTGYTERYERGRAVQVWRASTWDAWG